MPSWTNLVSSVSDITCTLACKCPSRGANTLQSTARCVDALAGPEFGWLQVCSQDYLLCIDQCATIGTHGGPELSLRDSHATACLAGHHCARVSGLVEEQEVRRQEMYLSLRSCTLYTDRQRRGRVSTTLCVYTDPCTQKMI
jgi:hypothetical protein